MSNILFDFDGTLFDTFPGISRCVNYAMKELGRPKLEEKTLRKFLGPPIFMSMREFAHIEEENVEEAVRLFRKEYVKGGLFECAPYDGIPALLERLKADGVKLCIASSKPQFAIELLLDKFALKGLFERVCGGDGAERSDDKSEKLKAAILEKDAVMVGDRKFDIEAAKKLGLRTVGVTYGFGGREELAKAGADKLAENSEELGKAIDEMIKEKFI